MEKKNQTNTKFERSEEQEEFTEQNGTPTKTENVEKEKYDEINNKYLRLCADFDNFRRRTSKEIIDTISTANKKLILDILPVLDDFERYFKSQESPDEGITIIYNKLKSILEKTGVKEIELAIGDNFDPEKSEAISKIKSEKDLSNKIVDIIEKGYELKNSIIRFAKVIIGE